MHVSASEFRCLVNRPARKFAAEERKNSLRTLPAASSGEVAVLCSRLIAAQFIEAAP
jgi:hypothetical protein